MKIEMFDVKARYLTPYEQENFTFLGELKQGQKWVIVLYKETRAYLKINEDFSWSEYIASKEMHAKCADLGRDFIIDICVLFKDNALSSDFI